MAKKTKRDIEKKVSRLDDDRDDSLGAVWIVFEDSETGEWYDDSHPDGDQVDPDGVDPLMVLPYDPGDTQRSGGPEGGHLDA